MLCDSSVTTRLRPWARLWPGGLAPSGSAARARAGEPADACPPSAVLTPLPSRLLGRRFLTKFSQWVALRGCSADTMADELLKILHYYSVLSLSLLPPCPAPGLRGLWLSLRNAPRPPSRGRPPLPLPLQGRPLQKWQLAGRGVVVSHPGPGTRAAGFLTPLWQDSGGCCGCVGAQVLSRPGWSGVLLPETPRRRACCR